jgi:Na+/proline symporter
MTVGWIIVASVINLIGIVAQPHTMEVCATGKTEWEGRVGFTYGSFIKRLCAIGWCFIGLIAVALFTLKKREDAFGTAIHELLPPGFSGLMIAAILAAQMSTLSAFMVASSALFSRNIFKRLLYADASDRAVLWMGRASGGLVVAGGVLFSFWVKGVADALTIFWMLTTFTGVFMWAGVLWRGANRMGAWASFAVMAVLWLLYGPTGSFLKPLLGGVIPGLACFGQKEDLVYLVLTYLPAGVLTLILVSLTTRPEPKEALDRFYLLLSTPVGQEERLRERGVDVVYAGTTHAHPLETKHPTAVNVVGFLVALGFSFAMLGLLWVLTRIGG